MVLRDINLDIENGKFVSFIGPSGGYLIFEAGAQYDTTVVFVGVIILALVGIVLSELLRVYETKVAVWQASQ